MSHIAGSANPADVFRHDRLLELVQSMLGLHEALSSAGPDHDRTLIARQIEATDRQIDALVCRALRPHGGGDRDCGGWLAR
ncbi:MAG: hypothetical protein MUE87_01265 [Methanothrix sp.]|nr:hypothetical protein [Methanothrix sp.]